MGKIEITICAARRLKNVERIGVIDPFVRILSGDKKYKTKVVDDTCDPTFDETFRFQIADEMSTQLRFEVWNKCRVSDDLLGFYTMSLAGLTKGIVKDEWYILDKSKTEAELHVRILALDFGRAPKPEEQWMVTQNILIDPVKRAIEDGRWRPGQTSIPLPPAGPLGPQTAQVVVQTAIPQQQQPQLPQQQPQVQYVPQQQQQPVQYAPQVPQQQYYPQQQQYQQPPQQYQQQYSPPPPPPQQQYQYGPPPPQQQPGYGPPPPQGYPPQGYPPQQPQQGYYPPQQSYGQPQGYY